MPPSAETVEVEYITPRHLAGGGDPAWITVPLHHACGWSHGDDPLMPRVILTSPDQKAQLRLDPAPDGQWWALHHAPDRGRPAWYASFGAHTPVEILAGFVDALTDPRPTRGKEAEPYGPLRQAGWGPAPTENGLASPDATACVQRPVGQETGPCAATATLGASRPVWQARFDEHTPPHLIAAFTAALAAPSPAIRTAPGRLPTRDPNRITRTEANVPVDLIAFALENRIRALAARRSAPLAAPSTPRRPPAHPGRTH